MDVLDDTIDKLNKAKIRQIVYKIQDDNIRSMLIKQKTNNKEQKHINAHVTNGSIMPKC